MNFNENSKRKTGNDPELNRDNRFCRRTRAEIPKLIVKNKMHTTAKRLTPTEINTVGQGISEVKPTKGSNPATGSRANPAATGPADSEAPVAAGSVLAFAASVAKNPTVFRRQMIRGATTKRLSMKTEAQTANVSMVARPGSIDERVK